MMKQFEAFPMMGQMNLDAFNKSMTVWNEGAQAIAAEASSYTMKVFEDSSAAAEKIMSAKSLEKAVELQASFAKKSYEAHMNQLNRFAELYTAVTKDVYKPVEKAFGGR